MLTTEQWIKQILSNDENSTDEELVAHFKTIGGLTEQKAREWVEKRSFYLNNIVMDDGTVYKPTFKKQ